MGSEVARTLRERQHTLQNRSGVRLELRAVVSRTFRTARAMGLEEELLFDRLEDALAERQIDCVVELIGGLDQAHAAIHEALSAGKHVVTANKALLATHGSELIAHARRNGVTIAFEASCAAGIPILRALYDGLAANEIEALYGIVNGTCNYILTKMVDHGERYIDALSAAQAERYAEADPTLDVDGTDSAHKIAIMATLAFGAHVDYRQLHVEGINRLSLDDVTYATRLGYIVKLLAVARRYNGGLAVFVRPAFISREHPLAWVSGPFNAVSIYGDATGHTMYYGRGAGGTPTASAVVADLVSIARGAYQPVFRAPCFWPQPESETSAAETTGANTTARNPQLIAVEELETRFYLRMSVDDTPGALARIADVLGKHDISIASVFQAEAPDERAPEPVHVVVTLHSTTEGRLRAAVKRIEALKSVRSPVSIIPIIDEHPERSFAGA